jgi:uncharacterized repeat protein (TIGR03803 family)
VPSLVTLASLVSQGVQPRGALVRDSTGNLFGTTAYGGPANDGIVFELPAGSGTITPLATFNGANGATPYAGLIIDSSGNLFGATTAGGLYDDGTVFEVVKGSGTITTLGVFNGVNGSFPQGGLIEDSVGNLFGTTLNGGPTDDGTVFEIANGTTTITTLATFNSTTGGANPQGGLVEDANGNLFGTTAYGGLPGDGSVFEVAAGSGTVTTLAGFFGMNGANPAAGLLEDSNGNLFGTTEYGGPVDDGTVFELQRGSHTITTLAIFNGANGSYPLGCLIMDTSGNLFGTTSYGGLTDNGTVFELANGMRTITTLASFSGNNGANPGAGLIADSSGSFYGTTENGGTALNGTVFEWQAKMLAISAPPTATAGTAFSVTVTAEDNSGNTATSFNGTVGLSSSAGADITPTSVALANGTATVFVTLTAAGNQTLTAAATGLTSGTSSITVGPGPVSGYILATAGSGTAQVGTNVLFTVNATDSYGNVITSYSGPPSVTPTISPSGVSYPITVAINSDGIGLFLANFQKVGSYTASLASGTLGSNSVSEKATPGPAAGLVFAVQPKNTPTGVSLPAVTVQVEDAYGNLVTTDSTDSITLGVASGPGHFAAGSTITGTVSGGLAVFNNLTLTVPGNYTLSAMVPAQYTGPNSSAFTVLPLQVVPGSLVGTPSGFTLQFNAPYLVNSMTPVLFGQGSGTKAPSPSVIVTTNPADLNDRAAYVLGSLVLHPATNSLTLVATNTTLEANNGSPLLPDGIYTVIIRSSAATNGFQARDMGGGYLDGRGTGTPGSGDFTATFTVGSAAAREDAVWVPATADGPGQALVAPGMNQNGGGYPIYLADSTGNVTSVQATLNYDPNLLTVTGVTGTGFTLLATSTPGHAVLRYSGPALPKGSQTAIGYLTATVPGGTTANPTSYRAKDLLLLADVSLNGGAIATVTSDGLHLVSYVGDADGNGSYSGNDAVLITRVALQADLGFAAYALVDPTIVADTDGSGFIPADAALQVNEAGVGVATLSLANPAIPGGVVFQPIANNVDPAVGIPRVLSIGADGTVAVPVSIDDAQPGGSTGLVEGHLALSYDPRTFSVSAADVHPGSLLSSGDWSIIPIIDQATGQITIALSSDTPITTTSSGSLVIIDFHVVAPLPLLAQLALVPSASPLGNYAATELEDAQGTFTVSLAPLSEPFSGPALRAGDLEKAIES